MAGIRTQVQTASRGNGTVTLPLHADSLPDGYGITHRWEAYAADTEPTDPGGPGVLTYLPDLIGTSHLVPNAMGLVGASGVQYHFLGGQVVLGTGNARRLMTPLNRAQPHTLVALIRPRAEGYTALSVILGASTSAGGRGSVYFTSDGKWAMNAGGTLTNPAAVKGAKWQVVTAVFDGANSVLRVDGEEVTGNAGTEVADRLILGSYGDMVAATPAYMGAVYYAPSAWTVSQRANFENWVRAINRLPFS